MIKIFSKMKKGFTLIELLAIIIVVGIVSVITFPMATNILNIVKEDTHKKSVISMAQSGVQYYSSNVLDFEYSENLYGLVSIDGKMPTTASIYVNNKGEATVAAIFENKCYIKDYDNNDVISSSNLDDCLISGPEGGYDYEYRGPIIALRKNSELILIRQERRKLGSINWINYEDYLKTLGYVDLVVNSNNLRLAYDNGGVMANFVWATTPVLDDTIRILTVDSGISRVGNYAFAVQRLNAAYFKKGVESIGRSTFYGSDLGKIFLPEGLTKIEWNAFSNNKLTSVDFPKTLLDIEEYAFYDNMLTDIDIPDHFTQIKNGVFAINNLINVDIPRGVTFIGYESFWYNKIERVNLPEGLVTIDELAFSDNYIANLKIPSTVKTIGPRAFTACPITSINIPNGVTYLAGFYRTNLSSITIPSSVTTIGYDAFAYNDLTSITIPSSVTKIESGAFDYNDLTSVTIPSSVTSLSGFSDNKLTSIVIPSSVTALEFYAFRNNQLSSVTFSSGIKTIGSSAFQNNKLTSVDIPSTIESISSSAFNLNNLTTPTTIIRKNQANVNVNAWAFTNNGPLRNQTITPTYLP